MVSTIFRPERAAPIAAVALGLLTLAASLANVPLEALTHQTGPGGPVADWLTTAPVAVSEAAVGALLAARRPRNPIGWILLALLLSAANPADLYAFFDYRMHHGTLPLGGVAVVLGGALPIVVLIAILLWVFPDGRLPPGRWRPLFTALAVAGLLLGLAAGLIPGITAVAGHHIRGLASGNFNPPTGAWAVVANVTNFAAVASLLAWMAVQIPGYQRSGGERRQQLKWLYSGATVFALVIVGGFLVPPLLGEAVGSDGPVVNDLIQLAAALLAVCIGVAVLKYRLYDIDVVISRTIVYGSLAAFITAVYVLVVVGIGSLGSGSAHAGSRPNLGLSILATAVVAVAFQPVRERAQRLANRLVFGKRATPYEALSEFAGRMGRTQATEDSLPRMAQVLAEGTGAARAVVWLKDGTELAAGACWPTNGAPPARVGFSGSKAPAIAGADRVALVYHQGEALGALSVTKRPGESLTPVEGKLMSDLAAQAGLLLHNIGLTEQLRARLAELQASRLRIAAAADDQRRRIERDIHDGAQQQLLTIASTLALAESVAGQDTERERALVAQLKAETSGTLETLRELARGIYPPLLADQGLAAAIRAQASKAPGPVEVSSDGLVRYPAEIETAVYFCCVEALHNAARHAPGSAVLISLADTGHGPQFEVTDNGPGFDPAAVAASGLRNMSDRLAALGGSCQVDSTPGRGTTVTGRIGLADEMAGSAGAVPSTAGMG
jgi:signal transduction histidine kinase